MNNFEKIKAMSIDQLIDWLDTNGHHDAIWWKWFEEKYCDKCDTITTLIPDYDGEETWLRPCVCSYCEENDKCFFFQEMEDVPNSKETIKLWLEAEVSDE